MSRSQATEFQLRAGIERLNEMQQRARAALVRGGDILIVSPTGSGKTEAALLPLLECLLRHDSKGIQLVYVTPLRALNRNLTERVSRLVSGSPITAAVRHGDTPASERRRQAAHPPDILITTPETLQAILPGKVMQRHLRNVRFVIIDEVHQFAEDRRGVQLAVALERLRRITEKDFQRIGLSATVGHPEQIAALFGGEKPLEVLLSPLEKKMEYRVEWPRPIDKDFETARDLYISPEAAASLSEIDDTLDESRSTLVFVNARPLAELLGSRLAMVRTDVGVHHGSLPREERERVEAGFKAGTIKGLVSTSTLELGIDIGSVDRVLQYMSPRQVTSFIQRVGRSGHTLERTSKGCILAVSADDAIESVAVVQAAEAKDLEPLHVHVNALDVLAHQIVGATLDRGGTANLEEVLEVIRKAGPYHGLDLEQAGKVVEFQDHLGVLRRQGENVRVTAKGRNYYYENLSTIRDERRYPVIDLTDQRPVGVLGEEFMVLHAKEGLHFIVRGRPWKIAKIGQDGVVYVTPVADPNAAIPGWDGEMLPVPYHLAQRVGALRKDIDRRLAKSGLEKTVAHFVKAWPMNKTGAKRLVEEVANHRKTECPVPTDDRIVVEAFDRFLVVHAAFGEVVNVTLGDLLEELLARKHLVRFWWTDPYRILYELVADTRELDVEGLVEDLLKIDDETLEGGLRALLEDHLPLGYYMKFIAERFGALRRGLTIGEGEMNSLEIRFANTPIYDEAVREALLLHADFERVREIVQRIRNGDIQVVVHKSDETPTPLAYPILRRYVEAPELFSPEAERAEILDRMRLHLMSEPVHMLCFECGRFHEEVRLGELPDHPECVQCRSRLLTVLGFSAWTVRDALAKRQRKLDLSDEERKLLTRSKQIADLVAVYGKRAVFASSVYGVGPTTASKILAKMDETEKEFLNDLFEAKLKYVTTRPYWNEPQAKPKMY
ncbi:MAG TPA: DEAD/DEAH box helicase [Thermoplasmata archaeon]|nr:DEAD/DEAH box helicase [Thermoplasmata archaeon]